MKRVEWTDETSWKEILGQGVHEDVVLTRHGHAVALLSPLDDDEMYWLERETDPAFVASIAEARDQVREGQTVSHDDLMRSLGFSENEESEPPEAKGRF